MSEAKTAFLDLTDFQHELGSVPVRLYPTAEAVLEGEACATDCGVAEVEIRLIRIHEASFAERVNSALEEGISPESLAGAFQVNVPTVKRWAAGKTAPQRDVQLDVTAWLERELAKVR